MENIRFFKSIELFVIESDISRSIEIRTHLKSRFGSLLRISTFSSYQEAVKVVNGQTEIILMKKQFLEENRDLIKKLTFENRDIKIIQLQSKEATGDEIEAYCIKRNKKQISLLRFSPQGIKVFKSKSHNQNFFRDNSILIYISLVIITTLTVYFFF